MFGTEIARPIHRIASDFGCLRWKLFIQEFRTTGGSRRRSVRVSTHRGKIPEVCVGASARNRLCSRDTQSVATRPDRAKFQLRRTDVILIFNRRAFRVPSSSGVSQVEWKVAIGKFRFSITIACYKREEMC